MNEIVRMISGKVVLGPKPGVYISGGIDSTIIVHHLREKYDGEIRSYTARFETDSDECRTARMVSEHYDTLHTEVKIDSFIAQFPEILAGFEHPRYNIWPYFLAKAAKKDGVKTVYNGEGGDQHFGGMAEKDYLMMWANFLVYTLPTWRIIHRDVGLDLRMPLVELDWNWSIQYFKQPQKLFLKTAYEGLIPELVRERNKAAPAFTNYWQMWEKELRQLLPDFEPKCVADIRKVLQLLATKAWIGTHNAEFGIEGGG